MYNALILIINCSIQSPGCMGSWTITTASLGWANLPDNGWVKTNLYDSPSDLLTPPRPTSLLSLLLNPYSSFSSSADRWDGCWAVEVLPADERPVNVTSLPVVVGDCVEKGKSSTGTKRWVTSLPKPMLRTMASACCLASVVVVSCELGSDGESVQQKKKSKMNHARFFRIVSVDKYTAFLVQVHALWAL